MSVLHTGRLTGLKGWLGAFEAKFANLRPESLRSHWDHAHSDPLELAIEVLVESDDLTSLEDGLRETIDYFRATL